MEEIKFEGGLNIAVKIPKGKYDETVRFYRDILKMVVEERPIRNATISRTHRVRFGVNVVWLDCVDNYTHSETWLELTTPNIDTASSYLKEHGVEKRDEFEELGPNMHWITDPAGTVLLVKEEKAN
jgi:catechol 2,3-dioxygenase-like lactoylglutathione lyase family enzyme